MKVVVAATGKHTMGHKIHRVNNHCLRLPPRIGKLSLSEAEYLMASHNDWLCKNCFPVGTEYWKDEGEQ